MTLMLALAPVAAVADEGAAPSTTATPQQSQPAPEATDATSAAGATRATNQRKTPPPPLADPYHKQQAEPKAVPEHAGENPVEGPQQQRY
jgi:hypothetical protein